MSGATLDSLLRRDQVVVRAALVALVVASWAYLVYLASAMTNMADMANMAMPAVHAWSWVEIAALVVMWSVMMVAMMTPSAAPMIVMFAAIHRRRVAAGRPAVATAIFVVGYLVIWTIFSVVAALAQAGLHAAALLSPAMVATSPLLSGLLLIVAGVFQWTPLKHTCLATCRSPMSFLMTGWRPGRRGAFMVGLRHGVYCLGCCWALMALLFVVGVMNLFWVAAIAAVVLLEKVAPGGHFLGRIGGVALVAAGVLLVFQTIAAS
jgi:predicted metal-binding membrane protein